MRSKQDHARPREDVGDLLEAKTSPSQMEGRAVAEDKAVRDDEVAVEDEAAAEEKVLAVDEEAR